MVCFYHGDMDGKCSAAIVRRYFKEKARIKLIQVEYGEEPPFHCVRKNEAVVVVDFCFKAEEWIKLHEKTRDITLIDHHKTTPGVLKDLPFDIHLIFSTEAAACQLTWDFYANYTAHTYNKGNELGSTEVVGAPNPLIVQMLADYDTYVFKFGEASKMLQMGIKMIETDPVNDTNWDMLFTDDKMVNNLVEGGKQLYMFRGMLYMEAVQKYAYFVDFEGHAAIACNSHEIRSQLFDSYQVGFDLMLPYNFDGEKWTVGIFTENEKIDCSAIAKKYGGGGHRGAAGFTCTELPFKKTGLQ